uniref:Uncharacterized protein n=1 Tax=uncultured prokaryote TaxID=198431 RepID=A0A0H5Q526_9ZZZZ|nr:hypothetical protein [uncultured prokaryote]
MNMGTYKWYNYICIAFAYKKNYNIIIYHKSQMEGLYGKQREHDIED